MSQIPQCFSTFGLLLKKSGLPDFPSPFGNAVLWLSGVYLSVIEIKKIHFSPLVFSSYMTDHTTCIKCIIPLPSCSPSARAPWRGSSNQRISWSPNPSCRSFRFLKSRPTQTRVRFIVHKWDFTSFFVHSPHQAQSNNSNASRFKTEHTHFIGLELWPAMPHSQSEWS